MNNSIPMSNSTAPEKGVTVIRERDPLEDSQILNRLQENGSEELTQLFAHMRNNLKAMISNRLDMRLHSRVDASDIVQETYIRALKSLSQYLASPTVHPVVWLRLLGKNLLAETHRQQFRSIRSPNREILANDSRCDFISEQLADSMPSILSRISNEELSRKVVLLIETMGDNDREILEMRHKDEMTLVEIAKVLDIPVETAKKRYQRALARFREFAGSLVN